VPLPWEAKAPAYGFNNTGEAWLPQPDAWAGLARDVQSADPTSTLSLYREALPLRRLLQTEERLEWIETGRPDVVRFVRPNGWQVVTNFGTAPFPLEAEHDAVVLGALQAGAVPGESTVWIAPVGLLG
jgi:alpha-glucosidase